MNEQTAKRYIQEKEAFHNMIIACPFFISIAVQTDNKLTADIPYQEKVYFNGFGFSKTKVLYFASLDEAKKFYSDYQTKTLQQPQSKLWCEYCKDLKPVQGILYHNDRIYVLSPQNKSLKEMLDDLSQMTIVDGMAFEQALKQRNHSLFKFVNNNALSLEYIYYRWRVYAYLQGDGDKRYHSQPFRIVEDGPEWFPPSLVSLPRGVLNYTQRKYFHQLLFKLGRKKSEIEEAMAFAIFNINCAVEIATIIALEIWQKLTEGEDFVKYFYLMSDILFNTTTQNYRRLFARLIPFFVHRLSKFKRQDSKYRGELKAVIQLWQIKFIFQENYTRGLLFLLNDNLRSQSVGIHHMLKEIGNIQDDAEGELQLEKLCFQNGIPFLETDKEQSTQLINQYLWQHSIQQQKVPPLSEQIDGEAISQKDLLKIRNKQLKVICCEGTTLSHLFEKNWQTRTNPHLDQD